jgi:hypothetical protein
MSNPFAINPSAPVQKEDVQKIVRSLQMAGPLAKAALIQDSMSIDSTQFLALGLVSLQDVAARAAGNITGLDFNIGDVFDTFTNDELSYADHVISISRAIQPGMAVDESVLYTGGSYGKNRRQVMIRSGLQTDELGSSYYEVAIRSIGAGKAPDTAAWKFTSDRVGVNLEHRMYIGEADASGTYYLTTSSGVDAFILGDPSVWTNTNQNVRSANVVKRYEQLLNALPRATKRAWVQGVKTEVAQQTIFYNILLLLKVESTKADTVVAAAAEVSPTGDDEVVANLELTTN